MVTTGDKQMTALNRTPNQANARRFTIDLGNNIEVHDSKHPASPDAGLVKFESEQDLAGLAANWPGGRLVEIWNKLSGVKRVVRFTDRRTAVRRIWRAIAGLEHRGGKHEATSGATAPSRGKAAKPKPAQRNGTKTEHILALLRRPAGATLKEIMALTGWQPHSLRGFISAHSKKVGLRVKSFKRNGERVYRILT
jgi:hypothetical protein